MGNTFQEHSYLATVVSQRTGALAVAVRSHGWVAVLVCPFFASVRPGVSCPLPPSPLAPFSPCLLQLPVWPSIRRPWPPPCSLLESGVLGSRGASLESAAARVCREAGGRVSTNVFLRDDLPVARTDGRRFEVVVDGLPLFGGAQIAVDTTLVSPVQADGRPAANVQSKTTQLLTRHDVSRPTRTQSSHALTGELGWSSLLRRQVVTGLWKPSILSTSCPKRKRGRSRGSCNCVRQAFHHRCSLLACAVSRPSPFHSAAQWWVLMGTFLPRLWSPIAATCFCRFDRAVFCFQDAALTDVSLHCLQKKKKKRTPMSGPPREEFGTFDGLCH